MSTLKIVDCKQPKFKGLVIDKECEVPLKNGSSLIVVHNLLPPQKRDEYVEKALKVERKSGLSALNSIKPRYEVCYTMDGNPYNYSGKDHYTTKFPQHVLDIIPYFFDVLPADNQYCQISNTVDIAYDNRNERGGSIGRHRDVGMDWGVIAIYSLGQSRWLRIRDEVTGDFINVKTRDNSLIAMYGASFQTDYTHQVDKLCEDEEVHTRLSLNVRFLKG